MKSKYFYKALTFYHANDLMYVAKYYYSVLSFDINIFSLLYISSRRMTSKDDKNMKLFRITKTFNEFHMSMKIEKNFSFIINL